MGKNQNKKPPFGLTRQTWKATKIGIIAAIIIALVIGFFFFGLQYFTSLKSEDIEKAVQKSLKEITIEKEKEISAEMFEYFPDGYIILSLNYQNEIVEKISRTRFDIEIKTDEITASIDNDEVEIVIPEIKIQGHLIRYNHLGFSTIPTTPDKATTFFGFTGKQLAGFTIEKNNQGIICAIGIREKQK